uniref:Proteasome assembly chaperone 1 n=1 Tax=Ciona savignyi TaxID=51511 RepID=H2YT58_CIOSA
MASFFGEILPVVSRAVDDDDSDDSEIIVPSFVWKGEDFTNLKFKHIVFGIGTVATGFIESYCLPNKDGNEKAKLCEIIDCENTGSKTKERCVLKVYCDDKEDTIFCTCMSHVASEIIWPLKDQIFSKFQINTSTNIIILDSAPIHDFKSNKDITAPFVRSLCTNNFNKKTVFPMLEQPNLVKGISAAILTACEVEDIPAELCVCFIATCVVDFASIQAFCPLLTNSAFANVTMDNDLSVTRIKSLLSNQATTH